MSEKFLVVGMGVFGRNIAAKLTQNGAEVVAVDSRMDLVEEVQEKVTYAACLNSIDEKALKNLNPGEFDTGIVCIGANFEANVLTSVLLKQNGVKQVITRASDPTHIRILEAVGIDQVITPEIEASEKLVNSLVHRNILDCSFVGLDTAVAKINLPPSFAGKTLKDAGFRAKYGVNVISIYRPEKNKDGKTTGEKVANKNPSADTVLNEGDILLVIGDISELQKIT